MREGFTRKENRLPQPALLESPCQSKRRTRWTRGPRYSGAGLRRGLSRRVRGVGKAPFISRAIAQPLLFIALLTILFFSFHPPSSPALAAGEVAPTLAWPCRGAVSVPFRGSDGPYGAGGHAGIDIEIATGSAVRASAPGTVSFAGGTPLGICVSVTHAGGFKTTYVSLQRASVRRGEAVIQGQVLGASDGSRDRSSRGPHLHFGLFLRGVPIDPLPFLQGRLLDPQDCLFLGPWEDWKSLESYLKRHDDGGFFGWLGRGFKAVGRAVSGAFKAVGRGLSAAWGWVCDAARAVGRAFKAVYRYCIEPWLSPVWEGLVKAVKWALSNRFVQAILAGLAAAALICLAVTGVGLLIGASLGAVITAAVAGSAAAIGYSVYYSFAAGDSFSFLGCFLSSLAVGGAVAATCLLFSYMAPVMGSGWSQVGLLGFGKSFLIHGVADSLSYIVFSAVSGREISPWGILATFCFGGLVGASGKLFTCGLLSQGSLQAAAAGWLSSGGGALLSGQNAAAVTAYLSGMVAGLAQRASFVLFSGCLGFLGDVTIRALTGKVPSLLESGLCFAGGALAGCMSLAAGGKGVSGMLSRMSGGRIDISSEWGKALVGKFLSRGLKESSTALIRRVTGKPRGMRREWLWSEQEVMME